MNAGRRRAPLGPRLALLVAGLLGALLVGAAALRSTETWITTDPDVTRRLLDLLADARRLKHDWEGAQIGDARFALDTEIRVAAAEIAALEATTAPPRRAHGADAWIALVPALPALARDAALRVAATVAALGLALLTCLALSRLAEGPRRLALALALTPLGLPPPVLAATVRRLAAGLGLAPSPGLAVAAAIVAGAPFAVALIWIATRRIDPREIEAAHDLGFSTTTVLRRVAVPALAPALTLAAVVVFARLLDDVSFARLLDADPAAGFGEWLRHRLVAALDFPGGTAGALLAALVCASAAALLLAAVVRHLRPEPANTPRRTIGPSRRPGWAVAALAPPALVLAPILVAGVGANPLFADAPVADALTAERLAAGLAEIGRAGLAALLATALAAAYALACDRATAATRHRAIAVVFVAAAVPATSIALALRLLADDLGLVAGPSLAVAATALVAAAFAAIPLLARRAPDEAPGAVAAAMRGEAFLRRLAAILPVVATLAYARALAAADLGTVVGLVDRTALLQPPAIAAGDPAALPALISAVATGVVGAWAIERLRRRPAS